jgi:hypothetical protein
VHLPLLLEPPEAVHQFVHVVTVVSAGVHDQGFLEFGVGELFVVPVIWIFVLHLDRVRPDLHNSHVALLPTNSEPSAQPMLSLLAKPHLAITDQGTLELCVREPLAASAIHVLHVDSVLLAVDPQDRRVEPHSCPTPVGPR